MVGGVGIGRVVAPGAVGSPRHGVIEAGTGLL